MGRPVVNESEYLIGGTGNVRSIYDLSDATRTHVFDQSDTARQVMPPAAHADFGGRRCYTFTGAEWYVSNRAPSQFRWLHDGTGSESTHVYSLTAAASTQALATTNGVATFVGYGHWISSAPAARLWVHNGAATVANPAAACPGAGVPTHSTVIYDETLASGQRVQVLIKSSVGIAGNPAVSPASGDPAATLSIGGTLVGGFGFTGRWQSAIFSPTLTAAQRATKFSYIQQQTGIVA